MVLTAQLVVLAAAQILNHQPAIGSAEGDAVAALGAAISLALYYAAVKIFERRSIVEIPGTRRLAQFATGLLTGATLFATVIAILLAAGDAHLTATGAIRPALLALGSAAAAAIFEEVLFRAMLFRLLERSTGIPAALLLSAALFALAHGGNPGAAFMAALAIFASGLLLGAAYALTRSLWFPIGIHLAWNATEGGVFGADVSGHGFAGLLATSLSGPAWMTGGAFGPEAGLPELLLCTATALLLLARARTRPAEQAPAAQ